MSESKKEIIVCKFDSELECTEYNCEYTCSELENLELDGEESCPLFKKEQLALIQIDAANKILAELNVDNFATGETRKDGSEYHNFNIDRWYARLKASLESPRKENLEAKKNE